MALLQRLERRLPRQLTAYEVMWSDFLEAACARDDISIPFSSIPFLAVLLEIENPDEAGVADALMECLEGLDIAGAVLAKSQRERAELWALRDAIGPLVSAMAIVEPFDVSVPNKDIGRFVSATRDMLKQELPDSTRLFFGHIADGNVHIALGLVEERHRAIAKAIVYDAVREIGGSISAEHGIGLLKRSWLGHSRTSAEIGLMRALRKTFNPLELLNPGRIF
ncbi:MAG TPA: FAD-linked oxidase C-terminal domain-containing protein [Novosphingobium sp.]